VADEGERAAAGIAGFIAVVVSLYGTLWVMLAALVAAQRPDPAIPDGDPCCTYPDTWHDVADGVFAALTLASLDALIFAGGVACARCARHGRWPSWKRLRLIPLAAAVLTATAMAVALI
jgi:hypothetical protein